MDSSELKLPLRVRTRKDGDKIRVKNLDGSKKVNDIFIDIKLSKKDRDIYPIIVDSEDKILWIPGVKKSHFDKQTNETYDIILEYVTKGIDNEKK